MSSASDRVVDVIVPAAGSGRRLGADLPKAFIEVAGVPLVLHALRGARAVMPRRVVVAVPRSGQMRGWTEVLSRAELPVETVVGGATRQESVREALAALARICSERGEAPPDLVLIHDAARPCASAELWSRVASAAAEIGAVIPVIAASDCLKRLTEQSRVESTLDRRRVVHAQTPQGFRFDWLWSAHHGGIDKRAPAADDSQLLEGIGLEVGTVPGEPGNIKVTTIEDLRMVSALLVGDGRAQA